MININQLKLQLLPVGVKFFPGTSELLETYPAYSGISYCDAVRKATEGEELLILKDSIVTCQWSPIILGLKAPQNAFEKRLAPLMKEDGTFFIAPLSAFSGLDITPDLVIIRDEPETLKKLIAEAGKENCAMHISGEMDKSTLGVLLDEKFPVKSLLTENANKILSGLSNKRWWYRLTEVMFSNTYTCDIFDRVISSFMSDMSICRNSTVIPYQTGKVNVSHFCTGGIAWGLNNPSHMTAGFPLGIFNSLSQKLSLNWPEKPEKTQFNGGNFIGNPSCSLRGMKKDNRLNSANDNLPDSPEKYAIELSQLFKADSCDFCCSCLKGCNWMNGIREKEEELFKRLVAGEYVKEILESCTNCMSCNSFCPNDANPHGLIVYRWYERYKSKGIPPVFKGAIPYNDANVWANLVKWMSRKEKSCLQEWQNASGAEEMLFLGCNQQFDPYIVFSEIFKDIPIFSDRQYCCGEPVFRLGLLEDANRCAVNLWEKFRDLGVKRLIVFCPACYNMMINVIPRNFGIDFDDDIELVPLVSWLKKKFDNNELKVNNRLNKTVTIQDSCHGNSLGEEYLNETRELTRLLGLRVEEMENSRGKMNCCGLGYAATRYSLADVVFKGSRRLREAKKTNADLTMTYCNGCYFTMNLMRLTYPPALQVYHLMELVQLATGEKPDRKINSRRLAIIAAALESVKTNYLHI